MELERGSYFGDARRSSQQESKNIRYCLAQAAKPVRITLLLFGGILVIDIHVYRNPWINSCPLQLYIVSFDSETKRAFVEPQPASKGAATNMSRTNRMSDFLILPKRSVFMILTPNAPECDY